MFICLIFWISFSYSKGLDSIVDNLFFFKLKRFIFSGLFDSAVIYIYQVSWMVQSATTPTSNSFLFKTSLCKYRAISGSNPSLILSRDISTISTAMPRTASIIDNAISNEGVIPNSLSYLDIPLGGSQSLSQNRPNLFPAFGRDSN